MQDNHSSSWFMFLAANRCFGTWIEIISNAFLFIVTLSYIFIPQSTATGDAALAISSLLSVMSSLQWGIRQSVETENYMTSIDRALEYTKLKTERELATKSTTTTEIWPCRGLVSFKNVSMIRSNKSVLQNISFTVMPSEKVGIVGRTGAGKSSIITALYRLVDFEGDIEIDHKNIREVSLSALRKNISIIPQNPILFQGTLRFNLDPLNQFHDSQLWQVLQNVKLTNVVSSLDNVVELGGVNFSVGQRQLLCLARAILTKKKILVMDEATAKVDAVTEALIQEHIQLAFSDSTIFTVAHRLNTVRNYDKILFLRNGCLVNYDKPTNLLVVQNLPNEK